MYQEFGYVWVVIEINFFFVTDILVFKLLALYVTEQYTTYPYSWGRQYFVLFVFI